MMVPIRFSLLSQKSSELLVDFDLNHALYYLALWVELYCKLPCSKETGFPAISESFNCSKVPQVIALLAIWQRKRFG
jgi:hypothetical protein